MNLGGFKLYRQLEQSDCGLTCIRMVARHFGKRIPLSILRQATESSRLGVSIGDICNCCKKIGIDSFPITPGFDELENIPCPAILHWQGNHFVVLYKVDVKKQLFYIADPAKGKIILSKQAFGQMWTQGERGIAILVTPAENFDSIKCITESKARQILKRITEEVGRHKRSFLYVFLLSLLCMLMELSIPYLFRRTIDDGLQLKNIGLVWIFISCQLAIFLGSFMSSSFMSYLLLKLGIKVNMRMMTHYLTRIAGKKAAFFDRKSPADLLQKMSDQGRIKSFLVTFPHTLLISIVGLVVFSSVLCIYSPFVFIFFIVISILETTWIGFFMGRRKGLDYGYFSESSENSNILYELIHGIQEIRINKAEKSKIELWRQSQNRIDNLSISTVLLDIWSNGGSSILSNLKNLAITGICATLVIEDSMTLGIMMTVGYLTGRLSTPFSTVSRAISQIQDVSMSTERLDEILTEEDDEKGTELPGDSGIVMKGLRFRYPGTSNRYVIDGVDIHIRQGETVALVGESGCGKTTLIKLMLGFYEPQQGELLLGGVPVGDCMCGEWMARCGVVMQNGYIFSDSILSNIAVSDTTPSEEKVKEALEVAGLLEFVSSLPMGLNTRIGRTGLELSGGQKQRLLIARAVYKNPDILFLDEATSSLDARNEREIHERLMEMSRKRTVIIAAHRLSTVKNADHILFIENGRIKESGTHEELVQLKGEYHSLVSNQLALSN